MNFAAFDLNLLRVFDALMRERSVTRAGEQIGLSQPAVSSALNRLRTLLDDQLLVRRSAEMIPTPRAEALAPAVRRALAEVEQALAGDRAFDPGSADRTFTLLASDFFATLLMPALAERLGRIAPGVRLRQVDSAFGDLERLLQEDVIDAALEPPPNRIGEWLASQRLFSSPFCVVARRDAPELEGLAPGAEVPLDLFCSLRHAIRSIDGSLSGVIDKALAEQGCARRVVLGLPTFQGVALAVARGGVVACLPSQFAEHAAQTLPLQLHALPFPAPVPEICLYWHSRHDRNPAHRWLREEIAALARPLDPAPA